MPFKGDTELLHKMSIKVLFWVLLFRVDEMQAFKISGMVTIYIFDKSFQLLYVNLINVLSLFRINVKNQRVKKSLRSKRFKAI